MNIASLEYTLEFLTASDVDEAIIVCNESSRAIDAYLRTSPPRKMKVTVRQMSRHSQGDALREVCEMDAIKDDFVLLPASVVCNVDLKAAVREHRDRRLSKEGKNAVVTVCLLSKSTSEGESFSVVMESNSKELLRCLAPEGTENVPLKLEADFLRDHRDLDIRSDVVDMGIYLCSPDVLLEFRDNFDYHDLMTDFIESVLSGEDLLGRKIYVHVSEKAYGAAFLRKSLSDYLRVNVDVLDRWSYPFLGRPLMSHLHLRACLGENCAVGKDVSLRGCVLWDHICVGNRVKAVGSLFCSHCSVGDDSSVGEGCVIGEGVVIPPNASIPAHSWLRKSPLSDSEYSIETVTQSAADMCSPNEPDSASEEEEEEEPDEQTSAAAAHAELLETAIRDIETGAKLEDTLHEINGRKFFLNLSASECACGILEAMLEIVIKRAQSNAAEQIRVLQVIVASYKGLIMSYLSEESMEESQMELLSCLVDFIESDESGHASLFSVLEYVLRVLYDAEIIEEPSFRQWMTDEKRTRFTEKAKPFLMWLEEAEEDDEDGNEAEEEDEEGGE